MGRRGLQAARSVRELWRAATLVDRTEAKKAMASWRWRSASFPIERLEDVSESLLAVAATLQVTTVIFDADTALKDGYAEYLFSVESLARYQAFALGFLSVVFFRWFHVSLFSAVARPSGRVRPITFALNSVFLLLVCIIPYTTAVVAANPSKSTPITFLHMVISCAAASLMMVAVSLNYSRALVRKGYESVVKLHLIQLGAICVVAAGFSIMFKIWKSAPKRTNWVSLTYVCVPIVVRAFFCKLSVKVREIERHHMPDTSRIEAFADGVFSLAATLAVTNFAAAIPVSADSESAFKHSAPDVLSFGIMFVVAYVLWSGNHHIYFSGDTATPSVLENTLNSFLLLVCGVVPFASNVLGHAFKDGIHDYNRMVATRFFSMVVFVAGITNFVMATTRACRTNWKNNKGLSLQAAMLPIVTALGQLLTEVTEWIAGPIAVLVLVPILYGWVGRRDQQQRLAESEKESKLLYGSDCEAGSAGVDKVSKVALDGGGKALLADDDATAALVAAEGAGDLVAGPAGLDDMSNAQLKDRVTQLTFESRQLYMEVLRLRAVTGEDGHLEHMSALAPSMRGSVNSPAGSGRSVRFSTEPSAGFDATHIVPVDGSAKPSE